MGWIQKQKNVTLNPKYKLPKMPYKGTSVTKQIMRVKKKPLVTDMRDVVEDPEFPLLTKKRPITVPERPKSSVRNRSDTTETAASSSQASEKPKPPTAPPRDPRSAAETSASSPAGQKNALNDVLQQTRSRLMYCQWFLLSDRVCVMFTRICHLALPFWELCAYQQARCAHPCCLLLTVYQY